MFSYEVRDFSGKLVERVKATFSAGRGKSGNPLIGIYLLDRRRKQAGVYALDHIPTGLRIGYIKGCTRAKAVADSLAVIAADTTDREKAANTLIPMLDQVEDMFFVLPSARTK